VFRALFEIVGLDGYEGREASIVDSVNFWWVLMQPLCRALAQRGGHEQVLESNDVWCRGRPCCGRPCRAVPRDGP
jgi:hypothetical protein